MSLKTPKNPTYNLRLSDIERIKQAAIQEATAAAWKLMLGLPVMALRDTFGFGPARLERFLESVLNKYDSYERGYITLSDVDTMLYDECGISIRDTAPVKSKRIF